MKKETKKPELTDDELLSLMIERGLTVERVIDSVIDNNGIIGVGLITLAENLYIYTMYNKELRREDLDKKDRDTIYRNARTRMISRRS